MNTEPLVIERLESPFEPPVLSRPCAAIGGLASSLYRTPEAGRIADEVQFFGGDGLEPLAFPDWETLPYDRFSLYQHIVSERLSTLYRLPRLPGDIVIAAVTTLMQQQVSD